MFLASYIEDGILHFKVSCGHQLITFSDPQHRVDTGHTHRYQSPTLIGPDLYRYCAPISYWSKWHQILIEYLSLTAGLFGQVVSVGSSEPGGRPHLRDRHQTERDPHHAGRAGDHLGAPPA